MFVVFFFFYFFVNFTIFCQLDSILIAFLFFGNVSVATHKSTAVIIRGLLPSAKIIIYEGLPAGQYLHMQGWRDIFPAGKRWKKLQGFPHSSPNMLPLIYSQEKGLRN